MLRSILDQARKDGIGVVELFVHESNEQAINLYRREGFEFVDGAFERVQGAFYEDEIGFYPKMERDIR
jgi:ribosomal protein S18 acetylase RimI-like enzyme